MKLTSQKRKGLFAEHHGIAPIVRDKVRLTIPVREALLAAGAKLEDQPDGRATITLDATMPAGIVAKHKSSTTMLRLEHEPDWSDAETGVYDDPWLQIDWTPCPVCGAPVIWYEAGHVPGYRVCSQPPYHHSLAR